MRAVRDSMTKVHRHPCQRNRPIRKLMTYPVAPPNQHCRLYLQQARQKVKQAIEKNAQAAHTEIGLKQSQHCQQCRYSVLSYLDWGKCHVPHKTFICKKGSPKNIKVSEFPPHRALVSNHVADQHFILSLLAYMALLAKPVKSIATSLATSPRKVSQDSKPTKTTLDKISIVGTGDKFTKSRCALFKINYGGISSSNKTSLDRIADPEKPSTPQTPLFCDDIEPPKFRSKKEACESDSKSSSSLASSVLDAATMEDEYQLQGGTRQSSFRSAIVTPRFTTPRKIREAVLDHLELKRELNKPYHHTFFNVVSKEF